MDFGVWKIITFDGIRDDAKPGRWLATINNAPDFQGYGPTEAKAVEDLKRFLRENHPTVPWWQNLPQERCATIGHVAERVDPSRAGA